MLPLPGKHRCNFYADKMIKIGITGAHTTAAGELIRILINHPDVVLMTVASEEVAGLRVDMLHRGLTGDTDMCVVPSLDPSGHDAVFLCGEPWEARRWMEMYDDVLDADEEHRVRVIDLTGAFRDGAFGMVYGLPEHNRKALVRGATRASLPSPAAMAVALALIPLAKNMLIQGPVTASAAIASAENVSSGIPDSPDAKGDVAVSTRLDPIAPIENRPDGDDAAREVTRLLRQIQPSFAWSVSLSISRDQKFPRGIIATVDTPASLPLAELCRRYDEAYDDHNFTYLLDRMPTPADVANTNKCLLHLAYPSNDPDVLSASPSLRVVSVIDNLLKGSAGNAVHCLNLLFGLSERTGLALKASAY